MKVAISKEQYMAVGKDSFLYAYLDGSWSLSLNTLAWNVISLNGMLSSLYACLWIACYASKTSVPKSLVFCLS